MPSIQLVTLPFLSFFFFLAPLCPTIIESRPLVARIYFSLSYIPEFSSNPGSWRVLWCFLVGVLVLFHENEISITLTIAQNPRNPSWDTQSINLKTPFKGNLFLLAGVGGRLTACVILVPWPGIDPVPPAVEMWSPNHWTAREVPEGSLSVWTHRVHIPSCSRSLIPLVELFVMVNKWKQCKCD